MPLEKGSFSPFFVYARADETFQIIERCAVFGAFPLGKGEMRQKGVRALGLRSAVLVASRGVFFVFEAVWKDAFKPFEERRKRRSLGANLGS